MQACGGKDQSRGGGGGRGSSWGGGSCLLLLPLDRDSSSLPHDQPAKLFPRAPSLTRLARPRHLPSEQLGASDGALQAPQACRLCAPRSRRRLPGHLAEADLQTPHGGQTHRGSSSYCLGPTFRDGVISDQFSQTATSRSHFTLSKVTENLKTSAGIVARFTLQPRVNENVLSVFTSNPSTIVGTKTTGSSFQPLTQLTLQIEHK